MGIPNSDGLCFVHFFLGFLLIVGVDFDAYVRSPHLFCSYRAGAATAEGVDYQIPYVGRH